MTGGVYTGGRYLTSRLMDHVDFYGGARRRRKRRLNQWVRFLVKMRKAFNKIKIRKGRFNIARDLYREFKRTGQLNKTGCQGAHSWKFHYLNQKLGCHYLVT
jgi:hypothetical protein